jgi:hypothetical protein
MCGQLISYPLELGGWRSFIAVHCSLLFLLLGSFVAFTQDTNSTGGLYSHWSHGPSSDPGYFPIAVWLQNPANAERFRDAGINTYIALWRGPTEEQLAELKHAGMHLICEKNEVALRHLDDPAIVGWMHGDEPDNAQSLGAGRGYGPPISPEKIVSDYQRLRVADPTRPVMLNLGQGVAWDGWYGRGDRTRHPEDYPRYLEGCDIVSFDIYPAVHDSAEIAGKLYYVGEGVERLVRWAGGKKIVWNCLECTHISNPDRKPTPLEVRSEAWMSIIHGTHGLIYFVHQFKPVFREAALLDDPEMLKGVTEINRQITKLAPVLNSPAMTNAVAVESVNSSVPIVVTARQHNGSIWIFAVAMRDGSTTATFRLKNSTDGTVEVLDEHRTLTAQKGIFKDHFSPWEVHLYRVAQ